MFLGQFIFFPEKKVVSLKKTKSCRIFKTNQEFFLPIPSSNLYIILVWKIYSRSHGNFSICFGDFQQQWYRSIPFILLIPWFFSFLCRSGWHLPLRLPFLARTCPFSEWCHSWVAFCFSSQWEVSTASATWQLIWWGSPAHCTLLIFIVFH